MARTTTTALLRTQKSRMDEERAWEDALLDYEWTLSAKTPDDWAEYLQHYQDRQKLYTDDPREALAAQKKIDSGFRAFQSNEIQRVAIDILEGNATEEDKLNKLTDLYYTSYGNGYYDLAQQLRYQIDNQIIKIQSAYASAAGGGGGGGGYGGSSGSYSDAQDKLIKAQVDAYVGDFKKENMPLYQNEDGSVVTLQDVSNLIKTQGEDGITAIAQALGYTDAQPAFEMIAGLVGTQIAELQKMASQIQDPATREKLLSEIRELQEYKLDIGSNGKTGNLTLLEIMDEAQARLNGNGKYGFANNGVDGFTLKEFTANDIATGANQIVDMYDEDGNIIGQKFTPMYGTSKSLNANYGYQHGEDVIYELKDGQYRPVHKTELKTSWDGKVFLQKGQFAQGKIFELLGLTEGADGTLQANEWLQKTLKNSGYPLDNGGLFNKAGVVFDPVSGMPEIMNPDGTQALTWQRDTNGNMLPVVWDAKSQDQYLKDIGYNANMNVSGLQPGASAAAIQAQRTGRFVQPGGVSGLLQQAGTVGRINQIQNAELEVLKVQEQQRQQELLRVSQLPKTTVNVTANAPAVQGFAVKPYTAPKLAGVQPYVAPKLGAVTTAPSTKMTSGGTSLQGGSSSALYKTGSLQVTSSPTTTGLKVK